jgi:adenine-specific DNA-methyltransferase
MPSPKLTLQTTTLWTYPSQHYGKGEQGSADYRGATPSWVIWNLLQRYTEPDAVVVDPMCGSGTTLDVAADLGRGGIGFDLAPHHPDIEQADARALPLGEEIADMVFIDPPYGQNLKYSGKPECIGELDARQQEYFDAMQLVFEEAWRVLKPGGHFAVYVCDVWTRKMFVPIGSHFLFMLSQIFEVVDHVAVARGNKDLDKGNYHKAAEETNFYLRGFNHLLIFRKPDAEFLQPVKKQKRRGKKPSGRGGRASEMVDPHSAHKGKGGSNSRSRRPGKGPK